MAERNDLFFGLSSPLQGKRRISDGVWDFCPLQRLFHTSFWLSFRSYRKQTSFQRPVIFVWPNLHVCESRIKETNIDFYCNTTAPPSSFNSNTVSECNILKTLCKYLLQLPSIMSNIYFPHQITLKSTWQYHCFVFCIFICVLIYWCYTF